MTGCDHAEKLRACLGLKPHPDAGLLAAVIAPLQDLARRHGIADVFQDNGGKILQVCLHLGLMPLRSREGNDAADDAGNEYELKTVNLSRTAQFTTHHHLNPNIIAKYRRVNWIFATYADTDLLEIYLLRAPDMEYWYRKWEAKWHAGGGKDINNPKIPLSYVRLYGERQYPEPVLIGQPGSHCR